MGTAMGDLVDGRFPRLDRSHSPNAITLRAGFPRSCALWANRDHHPAAFIVGAHRGRAARGSA
jgi:hypothetical protein